ncbi:biotin transporter BioY [Prochlorococcus sp. MIT 1341]|uniref:biotin transporter BioY n=1 Tax=Prochlorococcus sp. MIT 1341 TaxID=3096221 RepID=UPI002A74B83E|nr:biotin transporter BioY [Prochlorococcus sp. MIT 1341]
MRALVTWIGAIAGLTMILAGGLMPVGLFIPSTAQSPVVLNLPSTWQVPAVLLCSLVTGPRSGVIAAVAYITIGLVHLPVFNGGGNINYINNPGFGYLVGFIPAAWFAGRLAQQKGMDTIFSLPLSALAGLFCIQLVGILNLISGYLLGRWPYSLAELIFSYTLGPLPTQIALCTSVGILALILRRLLFIE